MGYYVKEEWQKRRIEGDIHCTCMRLPGGLLGLGREAKKREDSRGTCEGTGWATRLRKSGKKQIRGECVSVLGLWATRLRKRGKKGRVEGHVRVLGGLLG